LVSTGVPGLDDILVGGLDANRLYLIEGRPGTGKTTLALQYLLEGVRRGERGFMSRCRKARPSCGWWRPGTAGPWTRCRYSN
jgi:KaiC/GvpD/RAD55 family RecA-like ATPase